MTAGAQREQPARPACCPAPLSKQVDPWAFHLNAGFTVTPGVDIELGPGLGTRRHDLTAYNLGASVVWLARKNFNFLVETVAFWSEDLTDTGSVDHPFQAKAE